jgi:lipopolysaccharide biosynthesis glycosyltransferase
MTHISVVFATDNNYIIPTVTALTSLLVNKKQDTFYHIYILDDKITNENKEKFTWAQYKNTYELRFIPVNLPEIETANYRATWPAAIYAKFFICDLLPDVKKCIWIDSDTIILQDLSELYNTDLKEYCIGGVKSPDTNYNVATEEHHFLDRNKCILKCINVGVLLLNLDALRNLGGGDYFMKETLSTIALFPPKTPVTEQDMFNKLLSDNILYLPLKYNCYVENINMPARAHYAFCFDRKTIEDALNSPVIVHYTFKPWKFTNSDKLYAQPYKKYYKIWNDYYKISPLGNQRLLRKRLGIAYRLWFRFKPFFKRFDVLLNIKRKITKTPINSAMHDFYYY